MNQSLLQKIHNVLAIAAKSDDGKVNRKQVGDLAKQLNKVLKRQAEVDHDQRNTKSHLPVEKTADEVTK